MGRHILRATYGGATYLETLVGWEPVQASCGCRIQKVQSPCEKVQNPYDFFKVQKPSKFSIVLKTPYKTLRQTYSTHDKILTSINFTSSITPVLYFQHFDQAILKSPENIKSYSGTSERECQIVEYVRVLCAMQASIKYKEDKKEHIQTSSSMGNSSRNYTTSSWTVYHDRILNIIVDGLHHTLVSCASSSTSWLKGFSKP